MQSRLLNSTTQVDWRSYLSDVGGNHDSDIISIIGRLLAATRPRPARLEHNLLVRKAQVAMQADALDRL